MNNPDNFADRPSFGENFDINHNEVNIRNKENDLKQKLKDQAESKKADETKGNETSKEEEKKDESKGENDWRHMPTVDMDWMLISSYGDQLDSSIEAVPKELPDNASNTMMLARREMEAVLDVCWKDTGMFLKDVCPDFPGAQLSKGAHMERIKELMMSTKNEGVLIWYTGHGEKDTGNWCFKDGVISFEDVFALYMDHMRGKRITIVSDCSYSGNWIKLCAEKLDEIGIPACGHHAREQGILLKIFPSCQANEKAIIGCFAKEGVNISEKDNKIRFRCKALTSGQTSVYGDFRVLCCSNASGPCDVSSKWCDRLIARNRLFLVRGKDRGRQAWHYVLVDEDKLDDYNALFRDGARPRVNVSKYGKVLQSGWGENPPGSVKGKFDEYFFNY